MRHVKANQIMKQGLRLDTLNLASETRLKISWYLFGTRFLFQVQLPQRKKK